MASTSTLPSLPDHGTALIKSVVSGDCLVLYKPTATTNTATSIPQRTVLLYHITSPRYTFHGLRETNDELVAEASRSELRKFVGKIVKYELVKNRFKVVCEGIDLSGYMVEKGMARTEYSPWLEIQESNVNNKVGIYGEHGQRNVIVGGEDNLKYNTTYAGVIETCITGSTFQVMLTSNDNINTRYVIALHLAGITTPPTPRKDEDPNNFIAGIEALNFSEARILLRNVNVTLHSFSNNFFYGNVTVPQGNLSYVLLKAGFAKTVAWYINLPDASTLAANENAAKTAKVGLWKEAVAPSLASKLAASATTSVVSAHKPLSGEFSGVVTQVLSGDSIVVNDRTINLSGCIAPLWSTPLGRYSKEYLRSKLIGQTVNVRVDYNDTVVLKEKDGDEKKSDKPATKERCHCTVYLGKVNVNIEVLKSGWCSFNRRCSEVCVDFPELLKAEKDAAIPAPGSMPVDISVPTKESRSRAKALYPCLSRSWRKGIIEFVKPGRVKVWVPEENVAFGMSLAGIKVPTEGPFAEEAFAVLKKFLQYSCMVQVNVLTQKDAYVGSVTVGDQNLALLLLEKGYAKSAPSMSKLNIAQASVPIEQKAAAAKLGLWSIEEAVVQGCEDIGKNLHVEVLHVLTPTSFWYQLSLAVPTVSSIPPQVVGGFPSVGALVWAPFDGAFYRAKVEEKILNKFKVFFIDFGNSDIVDSKDICLLPKDVAALKVLAGKASLAHVKGPSKESEFYADALEYFTGLVLNGTFAMSVVDGTNRELSVVLSDVNEDMVAEGFARVKGNYKNLLAVQERAQKQRKNIWSYGIISDDEEEEY